MPQPPDLWLPSAPRRYWRIVAINVALHSLLLLVTIRPWLPAARRLIGPEVFLLELPSEGPQAVEMVFLAPAEGLGQGEQQGVTL